MNMDDKKIDELINKALQEEQALPEGLSRRLEKQIDTWASTEEKKTRSLTRRRTLLLLSQNLNKGISQVDNAGQEIDKVNNILNKHLND